MKSPNRFSVSLFYSYSHKDHRFRQKMEKSLALLRDQDGLLRDWFDGQILPGTSISANVKEKLQSSDIIVFLLSHHFLASKACRDEWQLARKRVATNRSTVCVPIILTPCPWRDLDAISDLKALPNDAKPITEFRNQDTAWLQVYQGIKSLIRKLRRTFTVRHDFKIAMDRTDFLSHDHITLDKIFVFPTLRSFSPTLSDERLENRIASAADLLSIRYLLVHGDELSGKSAICRHLFLKLVRRSKPVLYVNLKNIRPLAPEKIFQQSYCNQFHGDYLLWKEQDNKVVIFDNLTNSSHAINLVSASMKYFQTVIVTLSTEVYCAYCKDDERLAGFKEVQILPFTHSKQEQLIRLWARSSHQEELISDGLVDQIENRVNSVVISTRILPRYPFYILSVLQTCEGFMPNDLSITSYGHCYLIIIIAHLIKAGISNTDDELNACFNFAGHLAFRIFESGMAMERIGRSEFRHFQSEYRKQFVIKTSTLNRMIDSRYGIIKSSGEFRNPYMYYYFLGKHLGTNKERYSDYIQRLLAKSYSTSNSLTLIFLIHHTDDEELIEDILLHTMCTLDDLSPASLSHEEAKLMEVIIDEIPTRILSDTSVEAARRQERQLRDVQEDNRLDDPPQIEEDKSMEVVNDIYRIMKNNEILAQIIRNKYGSINRERLFEIVETIAEGGLRLVRLLLLNREEVEALARFVHKSDGGLDLDEIRRLITMLSYLWIRGNLQRIVDALDKPELTEIVDSVVAEKDSAAYDLIGYFRRLNVAENISKSDQRTLKRLWNKHRYPFFQRVISLRTQSYLNTHKVPTRTEQSICSLLGIEYRPRLKTLD